MSSRTDKWIKRNIFHHSEFSDLEEMVAAKQEQDLKISLCIPTLNEEKTIGKEVVLFRSELMERYPLLDELVIIDSGSDDKTMEVASSFGADVYLSSEILPCMGSKRGKGENLWKAIYQLKGDIIVYVDADIKNIHPRFVYGLVGPLIKRPEIGYVKAFYDRPLASSKGVRPSGGGRVTEILVRPLFSLFYPDLSAIVQPLSGEYAVRRNIIEKLQCPIGYGVETAHLMDIYLEWGIEAIGQTDLAQRVHRNQSTRDLGKMAFGILQTFLNRAKSQGVIENMKPFNETLLQFQVRNNSFEQVAYQITEEERPPMIDVAEYRRKFGIEQNDD